MVMRIHNRRTFIRFGYAGLLALLILVWNKLTLRYIHSVEAKNKLLPLQANRPVSFHGEYIVLNLDGETSVLSAHCTHLGCKIHEARNGRLICPCHGSEYDFNGNPIKGPAFKPLEKIPSKVSPDKSSIEIIK